MLTIHKKVEKVPLIYVQNILHPSFVGALDVVGETLAKANVQYSGTVSAPGPRYIWKRVMMTTPYPDYTYIGLRTALANRHVL